MNTQVAQSTVERHPADFSPQSGGAVPMVRPMAGIERVFGAQPVQVARDDSKVLAKLTTLAAAAGSDWFYRFPVRRKVKNERGADEWVTDWIEGPSIKLANNLLRIYGNCDVDTRVVDMGDSWLFYARFIDLESGFSMTRPFQQRKAQVSVNTKDPARAMDIAFQIGVSKAIRNVVVDALDFFADRAFEDARNALVEKVGADLPAWRQRTIDGVAKIPVALNRVERVIGRASKDWLAPDVARVIAMMKSIADGMATVEETFPDPNKPDEPEQPKGKQSLDQVLDQQFGPQDEKPPGAEGAQATTDEGKESSDRTSSEPKAPGGADLFKGGAAGPPTDGESYKTFARHVIANTETANLDAFFASDAQKKMRAACKVGKADYEAVQAWVREAVEKQKAPKK